MKKNYYSIEEDKYIIEIINDNKNLNIKSIAYSAFNKFEKKRSESSYIMRIHNARNYLLDDVGLSNIAEQQKDVINNFLKENPEDKLINQMRSL